MKSIGLLRLLSVIISLSFLYIACMANKAEADVSIIALKMSDEARAEKDNLGIIKSKLTLDKKDIPVEVEKLKRNYSLAFPKANVKNTLSSKKYGDNPVYSLKNGKKHDTAILYVHGGAHKINISPKHIEFCDRLVDVLDADVYMPLYSLIPYGTYKEAFQFLDLVYTDLLRKYTKICIAGDSAGGNITLTYTLHRKEKKLALPYKLIAMSPHIDMSMENSDILKYVNKDPMISYDGTFDLIRQYWAKDLNPKDWRVSPVYGDLKGLPDVLLFIAQDGIFYPDAIRLYNALQKAGNNAQLVIGTEHFHVFPIHKIPEQDICLKIIKDFCK